MTDWAFATLGYERIQALIQPGNVASQRAAERAGFVRTQHRRTCCSGSGEVLEHLVFVRQRPSPG
jgi:RimJ/RimL family protein N-acetyltransferase